MRPKIASLLKASFDEGDVEEIMQLIEPALAATEAALDRSCAFCALINRPFEQYPWCPNIANVHGYCHRWSPL